MKLAAAAEAAPLAVTSAYFFRNFRAFAAVRRAAEKARRFAFGAPGFFCFYYEARFSLEEAGDLSV